MRLSLYYLPLLGVLLSGRVSATGDSLYFLLPSDEVVLHQDQMSGKLLFEHELAAGQSLYGAARFYGLSLDEVYTLNPKLRAGYETGDRVKVAIPHVTLRPTFGVDSIAWYVPVRYELGKGETLFGLSRRTLKHPDESTLLALNPGLEASAMSVGKVLLVGYLRIDGIPEEAQEEVEDPYVLRNRGMRQLWEARTGGKRMKSLKGKAAWTSKGDRNKWMALHRTAPLNSLIEIEDPRSQKIIYAKVVGRIPPEMDADVIVVVSPLLVKAFGVRDKRFYVRTRFF